MERGGGVGGGGQGAGGVFVLRDRSMAGVLWGSLISVISYGRSFSGGNLLE